jgi:hypothetical protein
MNLPTDRFVVPDLLTHLFNCQVMGSRWNKRAIISYLSYSNGHYVLDSFLNNLILEYIVTNHRLTSACCDIFYLRFKESRESIIWQIFYEGSCNPLIGNLNKYRGCGSCNNFLMKDGQRLYRKLKLFERIDTTKPISTLLLYLVLHVQQSLYS